MIVKLYSPIGPPGVRLDGLIYYFAGGVGMPNGPVWALLASLKLQYWDGTAWQDFFPAVSDSQLSANVVILAAGVYPAGDGSLITNLPAAAIGSAGTVYGFQSNLDAFGTAVLTSGVNFPDPIAPATQAYIVACPISGTGVLQTTVNVCGVGGTVSLASVLGAGDAFATFSYHVAYQ